MNESLAFWMSRAGEGEARKFDKDDEDKDKKPDLVYRSGGFTNATFTPRPGVDTEASNPQKGLSTYRTVEKAVKDPGGKYQIIDLNLVRKLGFVVVEDNDGHVSILPPNPNQQQKLEDWAATRGTEKVDYRTIFLKFGARIGESKRPK